MTDPREVGSAGMRCDDPARFLRELRELRSHAGLGHAELAARAHYPCDAIKAAEAGPALPGLPVLSAYVRGCGGTVAEWEERWRAATGCPTSPLLTARATGWSEAADAGARVGAACAAADPDADRVMAALNRVAGTMAAAAAASSSPASPGPAPAAVAAGIAAPAPAGPGDGQAAASAGFPVVVPGQEARSRRPPPSGTVLASRPERARWTVAPSRTVLVAVAAVTLLLLATVLALFA